MPRISYFGISLDIRIFNITDGGTTSMRKTLGATKPADINKTNRHARATASHKKQTSSRTPELLKYFVLAFS